ncbi:MAG TPA: branched-chain amino acid transaminase [Burkholderiales bacterium]|jgi:branched-chain amino acid aminotransferase
MSMSQRDGWIWFDGALKPWAECATHVLTHTLHYGLGVFEGVRAYSTARGPAVFRLGDHTKRLMQSAHILGIDMPYSQAQMEAAQLEVLRANKLKAAYIRPLVFMGSERMGISTDGVSPHVAIAAWEWGAYLGQSALENGIRVKISSFARHHVNVQMCRSKSVSTYANSILANREARQDGYDEALLLDTDGFVAEGSGENIFLVRDGKLIEPELASALEGVTRRAIIDFAREAGIPYEARRVTRDEVYIADEVFFTGTAAEVTPVVEVDRRRIGSGKRGPITEMMQKKFFDCVHGEDTTRASWLTYVN